MPKEVGDGSAVGVEDGDTVGTVAWVVAGVAAGVAVEVGEEVGVGDFGREVN
jgi:hypothetical protein